MKIGCYIYIYIYIYMFYIFKMFSFKYMNVCILTNKKVWHDEIYP